jgi:dihydrofolate reductase
MAKLIYATRTSLDGYIADDGNFEWSAPDHEVFAFMSDVLRPVGTYLYGHRT